MTTTATRRRPSRFCSPPWRWGTEMSGNSMILTVSVTEADLRTFLRIFAETKDYGQPAQIQDRPMIELDGVNYKITTPRLYPDRASVLLHRFERNRVSSNDDPQR